MPNHTPGIRTAFPVLFCLFFWVNLHAQVGKNGARTISTSATVVNDYTTLTTDASSGATTIQVASSSLSANFSSTLSAGDLIFIIQIQGASISTADDSTYGTITSYNNCGNHEFAEVASVPSGTSITLSCPLAYNYTAAGKTQIIRVPRFTTLTVNGGSSVSPPAWNGSTGGVVVVEVQGATTINGIVDVSGKGFRGGSLASDNQSIYGVLNWRYLTGDFGGEKGESIAGSQTDYDGMNGRYCKGAPANGGGGASGHDAGGGGGGNCGSLSWTGRGNPDVSTPSWASAWNLIYSGFASSTSSGGGEGGFSFSSSNQNALTMGTFNSSWGGDQRRDNGGRGGRPLNYTGGRLYFGGAGGAGDQNDAEGGNGGNGGGMVYMLCYSTISGTGLINANGQNGFNTTGPGKDGAGGGGAGGTVVLDAMGTISGILVSANGGAGGNQILGAFIVEAEGPGGGGGGGYIAKSNGAITCFANGGNNGTTDSYGLTEFPPNGATKGGSGLPNEAISTMHIVSDTIGVCSGQTATLTVATTGVVPPGTIFNWYSVATGGSVIATGTTFTTPVITSGPVTYYVSTCPGTTRTPMVVNVSSVTTSFTATSVCAGTATVFTGTASASAGTISSWAWNFGSGSSTSSSQNPSFTYPSSGNYTVTLTATDNNGCTSSATQTVTVSAVPVISFSAATLSGCAPLTVAFSNSSTGASSFVWDFGDGTSVFSSTPPSHTYNATGVYTVTVTATNGSCTSTGTVTNMITVNNKPTASFSSGSSVCLGDPINFTNLSTANGTTITGYTWNFGDGSATSSANSPSHTYATSGTFSVTLTANSSSCNDDTTISVTVNPAPVAAFTAPVLSGCDSLRVTFANTTSGSPTYTWNFGDGSASSSATNPTHTYTTSGTYTVTLIAVTGSCRDTLIRTNYLTVHNQPTSSFTATSVCQGDSVHFTNTSTGNGDPITGYTWNFGDGGSSTILSPAHWYVAAGNYSVTLSTSTAYCTDIETLSVSVTSGPVVNFSAPSTGGCGSLTVNFSNTTSGSPTYNWNFGDGSSGSSSATPSHTYTTAGTYNVTLIATQGSCSDTMTRPAYINVYNSPLSSFSAANVCLGDSVRFTNLSSSSDPIAAYAWNFGDLTTSAISNPVHYYSAAGTYTVQLTASTANCSDDTTINVTVSPGPLASFTASSVSQCGLSPITFSNSTTGSPSFTWNFGDGSATSSQTSPVHTYSAAGNYTVSLIASQGSCADTLTRTNYISIYNQPTASFSTSNVCIGDSVRFTNSTSSVDPVVSWAWNFGDGNSSALQNPVHYYSSAGTYTVHLSASTTNCVDDTTITVTVSPGPVVSFAASATTVCGNQAITFNNTTTGSPAYSWNFGDGNTSTQLSPSHSYSAAGTYSVTLIAVQGSCSDTLVRSSYITVNNSPTSSFSASSVCLNDSVHFTNLSNANGGTITSYVWTFGDGGTSSSITPAHLYTTSGTYNVQLTASNGTCSDDTTISVTVNARPVVAFTTSSVSACDTLTVQFTNATTGASSYTWYFGDGFTSNSTSPSHLYSTPGTYSVTLTSSAAGGCSASLSQLNLITINPSPEVAFTTAQTSVCLNSCITFTNQSGTGITSYSWSFSGGNPSSSIAQNPPQVCYGNTGNFNVSLTVSNGQCSATLSQASLIHVANCSAKPLANFVCSDTTLCGGSCINFVDLSLNSISWHWQFPGATPSSSTQENPAGICYSAAGTYPVTLICSNTNGSDTLTVNSFITVYSAPGVPTFSQSGNVLTTGPAAGYQWYYGNIAISGAIQQSYTATLSGYYSVMITDANGCTATSAAQHISLVGIEEADSDAPYFVFPNPVISELNINFGQYYSSSISFNIYNSIGQSLYSEKHEKNLSGSDHTISVGDLAPGVYYLIVKTDDHSWVTRFIR